MRVLVTGGGGYLGGKIARHLKRIGHQVTIASSQAPSSFDSFPPESIISLPWNSQALLSQALTNFDAIVHSAGIDAKNSIADPNLAKEFNGRATKRLVDAAVSSGIKTFIYLSTIHVYGNPLLGLINEDTEANNLHPYAVSHLLGEKSLIAKLIDGKIQGLVLRLSNVFGEPANQVQSCWDLAVNHMCKELVENNTITLNTSGNQIRNFLPITNLCHTVSFILSNKYSEPLPLILNLGSVRNYSILQMAEKVKLQATLFNFHSEIITHKIEKETSSFEFQFTSIHKNFLRLIPAMNEESEINNLIAFCATKFGSNRVSGSMK
jgi:UDP-glucose 4-epimerase